MLFVNQNYYFPTTFIPFVEKYLLKERRGSVAGVQGTRTAINKTPKLTRNEISMNIVINRYSNSRFCYIPLPPNICIKGHIRNRLLPVLHSRALICHTTLLLINIARKLLANSFSRGMCTRHNFIPDRSCSFKAENKFPRDALITDPVPCIPWLQPTRQLSEF